MQLRDLLLFDTRFFFISTCHCGTLFNCSFLFALYTCSIHELAFLSSQKIKVYLTSAKRRKSKKRAEPSTWLANYTHTCAPTCRYLAHVCRRERQSASLLLHSSYIYYCPVVHIYTAAAWRLLSFLDVVRGGVREGISEGNTTVVEHLCAMQRQ